MAQNGVSYIPPIDSPVTSSTKKLVEPESEIFGNSSPNDILVTGEREIEDGTFNRTHQQSETSLDLLHNSSRFSFEASSTAESVHNEELTLSEGLLARKSQFRSAFNASKRSFSDDGSFRSDDGLSITSDDLLDEYGDGFATSNPYSEGLVNIAPPPGFEHLMINGQPPSQWPIEHDEENTLGIDLPPADIEPALSTNPASSERGTNGSTTEDEDSEGVVPTASYPPFVNPSGAGPPTLLGQGTKDGDLDEDLQSHPPAFTFHNVFQTGPQGVSEYDTGSPSHMAAIQSPMNTSYDTVEFVYDDDGGEEDDMMIAEANRDALASDNEGWYGQEFGFYPTSSTNGTYLAGGFFGIEPPKPGFVRNPSLTPISERSESSLRNSLSLVSPGSLNTGGISAGPLSAALLAELANSGQLACDETTLGQLQLLNINKSQEDVENRQIGLTASTSAMPVIGFSGKGPLFPLSTVTNQDADPSSGSNPEDLNCQHALETTTSYVHDVELGWVMEQRKGGEVIRRELVQGAV
ncbi:hypothetical protein ABW19_dt0205727 [Dactylella cylindrospora]|nr:hypothetical protein ABW19_dt0205727 [Dactylella cylindrospora]